MCMRVIFDPASCSAAIAENAVTPPAVSPRVNWFCPESCLMSVWNWIICCGAMPFKGFDCSQRIASSPMLSPVMRFVSQLASASTSRLAFLRASIRIFADIARFSSM
ncbi:MAG: hypothetical protein BWY06_03274 [Candidatus Latescibacteria bacterium ADurb.Bin168]|nr:MAG: hypothetical protein BWY06_03274 [Candidatus Latescibacteria bacterium ADurb.Bin168]